MKIITMSLVMFSTFFLYAQKGSSTLVDSVSIIDQQAHFLAGKYRNDIIGACYSEIEILENGVYVYDFLCSGSSYYDVGILVYKDNIVEFSSLVAEFSDKSCPDFYHNTILDMTGVQFIFDSVITYREEKIYQLTSTGDKAFELNISNDDRKIWSRYLKE